MSDLVFRLDVRAPERRRIVVELEVDRTALAPAADGATEFFLPTWTPGSYLIREYARHLGPVCASDAATGAAVPCVKSRKNRYRVDLPAGVQRLRLRYDVYAHELTVRTSDVTDRHAYWNHACVLLWPVDRPDAAADVAVRVPPGWDCCGGVPVERAGDGAFSYRLADLDTAIDSPMLAGAFERLELDVLGVRHVLALDDHGPVRPVESFAADVRHIVERAAAVFGDALPYPHYTFLCLFAQSGYGGLEHRDSTTLLSPRSVLAGGKGYRDFLGLLAHELFHAWNVKRMRPEELWRYDYENETHTSMLWLAEGWTAYYDDLLCRRAGAFSVAQYLEQIERNLGGLWSGAGRFRQSLAESSFDAWIRYYRPDENTRNQTQNYYGNGALAAMALDLTIRDATDGARSLDDVLRRLWQTTWERGRGYRREDVAACLSEVAGRDLGPMLRELTEGPLDPDFDRLLQLVGIRIEADDADRPWFGLALENGRTQVASVTDDSPAHASGIAPGDELLALDGLRVRSDCWTDVVNATAQIDRPLRVLTASRGLIVERTLVPSKPPRSKVRLVLADEIDARTASLRRGWLGDDTAS
ncbi:MAG: M61 family metallopeptidase [Planctomycetota bacterium]